MIDVISPFARQELATKHDLALLRSDFVELRGEVRADIAGLKHDLLRTMAGWIFLSQAALVAMVALIVSLA